MNTANNNTGQILASFKENATRMDLCAGCGDIAVVRMMPQALAELGITPHDVCYISGIGCSGQVATYINGNVLKADHGRALAMAYGLKMAQPHLTVILFVGDGDTYSIGMEHFVHTARSNINIVVVVMNNLIYGLTKGQHSPTAHLDDPSTQEQPVNPLEIALGAGATFIARAFSGNPQETKEIFKRALTHKGFSLIDVFSPCVTYNRMNTYDWFRERCYYIEKKHPAYKTGSRTRAFALMELTERLPLGVFYETSRPTPTDNKQPLTECPLEQIDLSPILAEFA